MDRSYILAIILIILISTVSVAQGADLTSSLSGGPFFYRGNYVLSLDRFSLTLPGDNIKTFSPEGQQKLFDLALRYGDAEDRNINSLEGIEGLNLPLAPGEFSLREDEKEITVEDQPVTTLYNPSPEVMINAEYDHEDKDQEQMLSTNINLNYQMNSRTMLRAGYGLSSRKWWNINDLNLSDNNDGDNSDNEDSSDDESKTAEEKSDNETDNSGKVNKDAVNTTSYLNRELNQQGSVGISYQTSDNIIFSADYIHNSDFAGVEGDSTILGLEYVDDSGKIRAQYQVNRGEDQTQTITGVELDLRDLATFSASYKLLDPQYIEDTLEKDSVWDFGLDINLNQFSSFSVGYQLAPSGETKSEDMDKESNINASFKINF